MFVERGAESVYDPGMSKLSACFVVGTLAVAACGSDGNTVADAASR